MIVESLPANCSHRTAGSRGHDVAGGGVLKHLAASGRPCALYGAYCRGVGSAAVFFAALFGLLQQCDVAARRKSGISDWARRQRLPDAPRGRQVSESANCNAVFARGNDASAQTSDEVVTRVPIPDGMIDPSLRRLRRR